MAQFEIVNGVLKKCLPDKGETEIIIPDGVNRIEDSLFRGRRSITKVQLPTTLTKIGSQAFNGCASLAECNFPEILTEIGDHAFAGCAALKSIDLPKNMSCISSAVFADCTNLQGVTIPEGVKKIDSIAFKGCSNLSELTLPESVEDLESGMIFGTGISEIRIPAAVSTIWYDSFEGAAELKKIEFAVFPQHSSAMYETVKKMIKNYPYLADAVAAADNVPQDIINYIDWIKNGSASPREEDLLWAEKLIEKLQYDDYIMILDTNKKIDMKLFHVIGNEYTDSCNEAFNNSSEEAQAIYCEWKDHLIWMSNNDRKLRAYRYEHGKLVETRELDTRLYDWSIYKFFVTEAILYEEFGLEPQDSKRKEGFAAALAEAEQYKKTLFYACCINDTAAIIERAKTAKKSELNFFSQDKSATPAMLCARNNNLEGFKALAEAGADLITAKRGYFHPLTEAREHSPAIMRYVFDTYPDVFDARFKGWKNNAFYCNDWSLVEDMFRRYGAKGLEDEYFQALYKTAKMDILQFLISHHVDCICVVSDYKCNAVQYAEQMCQENPDSEEYKTALELIRQEASRQQS